MKNFHYRYTTNSFIISPTEHEFIVEQGKQGRTQIWLRNSTLMINLSLVMSVSPTDELTEIEEQQRDKQLLLGAGNLGVDPKGRQVFMRKWHKETFDKMKWVHGKQESCKYPECNVGNTAVVVIEKQNQFYHKTSSINETIKAK